MTQQPPDIRPGDKLYAYDRTTGELVATGEAVPHTPRRLFPGTHPDALMSLEAWAQEPPQEHR